MEKYEKAIGLKTIWLTFVRRWKIILIIFVPAALATLIVTQFFIPKQYQSSASFLNNASLTSTTHNAAQLQIKKEATLDKAVKYLESDYSITNISASNILNGLTFTAFNSNNPSVVSFSYTTKQQKFAKPVTEALSKAGLEELQANGFDKMTISSPASNPVSVGKGKQYLLIGLVASTVLSLGIAFADEIASDEVYDEDDIAMLGSSSYGLIVSKNRRLD